MIPFTSRVSMVGAIPTGTLGCMGDPPSILPHLGRTFIFNYQLVNYDSYSNMIIENGALMGCFFLMV